MRTRCSVAPVASPLAHLSPDVTKAPRERRVTFDK
jgi:hypothetical protein